MSNQPKNLQVGKNVVIHADVRMGDNVTIGDNTVIYSGTEIGNEVEIGANCVLGIIPGGNQRMRKTGTDRAPLRIGNGTKIGHLVSIYSGTTLESYNFIGDHASIRENVRIGKETVIGRAALVELNTTIGDRCTIQTLVYVTGDTTIEDRVFIGPCVSMSNDKYMGAKNYSMKGPHIRTEAKIGNNASLLPDVTIGEKTIVGAGAVVTKDTENGVIVTGVPAKVLKEGNEAE
ncbi:acetyltransferase-like isoleucine patch superfamily enzyme [Geomicrobium halophilum]|uniref:Acetyltransferase-like isoleucine patch superfamily enzyme n=1 Tax=Geomicrobium halophilum TaxID=549000 RepID=A0A841PUM1_9BACL|nr:acetyltransferase-like isoleucine patch superfamily enzyme [Geomicrobium halophilum]